MKISIIIPAYEVNGIGNQLITELLQTISLQTYKDVEVVVPDHSITNIIKDAIEPWSDKLNIVHFFNDSGRGNSSINMNAGIKKATGDIIKIMHIDDVFCNINALKLLNEGLIKDSRIKWGTFGFQHNFVERNVIADVMMPEIIYNPAIGHSALRGCPSVSFFINDKQTFFDEELIIINDFEMHYRLEKKYGKPFIFNDIFITIRMHNNQVTKILDNYQNKELKEIMYFKTKKYE